MTALSEPIEILTADEIAKMLRVDRKTVYEAAQRGALPHRRLGRRLLFERRPRYIHGQPSALSMNIVPVIGEAVG